MDEIKGDVQRLVKRRKDSGFTLIELMIVIAVIGILAVVLVPKFGSVKTTAKLAGVETNFRSVSTAVQSFNTLNSKDSEAELITTVEGDLAGFFKNSDALINPITNLTTETTVADVVQVIDASATEPVPTTTENNSYVGKIVIYPHVDTGIVVVDIYGCDQEGKAMANLVTSIRP